MGIWSPARHATSPSSRLRLADGDIATAIQRIQLLLCKASISTYPLPDDVFLLQSQYIGKPCLRQHSPVQPQFK